MDPKESTTKPVETHPAELEITAEHHALYRRAFELFDRDADQSISPDELSTVMARLGQNPTDTELAQFITQFDLNKNGKIEFFEFVKRMEHRRASVGEAARELEAAFGLFDRDGNGFIDREELFALMESIGEPVTEVQLDALLAEADLDGDGRVNFEEFMAMMNKKD